MPDPHETPTPEQPPELCHSFDVDGTAVTVRGTPALTDRQREAFAGVVRAVVADLGPGAPQPDTATITLTPEPAARPELWVDVNAPDRTPDPLPDYLTPAPPCPSCGSRGLCSCTRLA